MCKSTTINSPLATLNKSKTISVGFILCAAFIVLAAVPGNAQIKIGSTVHLQNQYAEKPTYLDTRGRVMDKPEFKGVSENWFVSTHTSTNRDNGSGSWKIVSATGKKDGAALMYGDEIHLLNGYPGGSYLDVWSQSLPIFSTINKPSEKNYPVFASTAKNRDNGSGTWIIRNANNPDDTSEVKENSAIMLESKRFPKNYLETNGAVMHPSLPFKEYAGNVYLVFVTNKDGFHAGSQKWKISLKK